MSALWIAVALLMILVVSIRLELSFDLSAFLPQRTTLTQDILVEQIRTGPGSRLLVIGISGPSPSQLIEVSEALRQRLSTDAAFATVLNGEIAEDSTSVPEPVKSYYLLLRDVDYSAAALQGAIQLRLRDLAFGAGATLLELIARDPYLVTLDVAERLAPVDMTDDMWFAADGSAVLMAETSAAAIDIGAQTEAVRAIHDSFASLTQGSGLELDVTGVGAFSVELQETIRAEAMKRTVLASAAVLLVLLIVFRKLRLLLLAAAPLGIGFLAGLALVSLLFDRVHGITLAFGFTLLGIAVDYPLHLFSHAERESGPDAMRNIWPTMRLGVISTAIAYLALAFSGSEGLAQLGLFTTAGVAVAVLATRTWLPVLTRQTESIAAERSAAPGPQLRFAASLLVLLAGLAATSPTLQAGLWDDNLSSLSPVSVGRLAADRTLRAAAKTPDMRYQLVLHDRSLEALLQRAEAVDLLLADAVEDGLLQGWQSVPQLLPSQATQRRRQQAIPADDILQERLDAAISNTPFRADAFAPFVANARTAKGLPMLSPPLVEGTPLRSWLDSHLLQLGDEWAAMISVRQPLPAELASRVADWDVDVEFVDLQSSALELMRDYRSGALRTIFVAALLIVCLLWFARGEFRQMLWIGLTVTASLLATIATVTALQGSLTVIHLVALLLVLGLGLDYALFLSRSESRDGQRATDKGVFACAASTTLAFGVLAASSIPLLKFLGLTVATGSMISYLTAYLGSRSPWRGTRRNAA